MGINKAVYTSLGDAHEIGQSDSSIVKREGQRCAMKVPARENLTSIGEHQWIIGGASRFDLDGFSRVCERSTHRAVYLRHATQAIGVLHARIVFQMRPPDLALA